jgi:hypothetical protein
MIKYDVFTTETNEKFSDYELALSELEKNIPLPEENKENVDGTEGTEETTNVGENDASSENIIMSVDLKNIIKQELASST